MLRRIEKAGARMEDEMTRATDNINVSQEDLAGMLSDPQTIPAARHVEILKAQLANARAEIYQKNLTITHILTRAEFMVQFSYYLRDRYMECGYCSSGWILSEFPPQNWRFCPNCGYKICAIVDIPIGEDND